MSEDERLFAEIRSRLGFIPAFLIAARQTPQVLEGLWRQMLLAHLDNPLPALFKEKLLAYLARYCPHHYCLIHFSCGLRELGLTAPRIASLLKRPTPTPSELSDQIEAVQGLEAWPDASSPQEWAIFWLAVELFLQRDHESECQRALVGAIGPSLYDHLSALLAYARALHQWVLSHPQISPEGDLPVRTHLQSLMAEEPGLAELFDMGAMTSQQDGQTRAERMVMRINHQEELSMLLGKCNGCPGTALLQAPFPIMIYAEDGQVVQINDVWTELSGYSLGDTPTLAAWCDKAQPGTEPHSTEDIDALFESDQRVEEGEHVVITRHGGELVWDFSSVPLGRLPDGRRAILRVASDVTERKQLEKTLWTTNHRVVRILESITDGFFSLDHEWRLVYINDRAEQMMRQPRQEILGRDFRELFPHSDEMPLLEQMRQAELRSEAACFDMCHRPTGRWYEMRIFPSSDGLSVYFRDITQRVKLAEKLRRTNRMLQALVQASPLAVVAMDRDSNVMLWSPAAERIFGWKADEVLGRPMPIIPPDQLARQRALRQEAISSGQPVYFEAERLTKAGRRLEVGVWTSAPVPDAKADEFCTVALLADITLRKRAEEALHEHTEILGTVLRASPLAIVVLGLDAQVKLWNPAAERLFGWDEREVLGRKLPVIAAEFEDQFRANRDLLLQGRWPGGTMQAPCLRKDGSHFLANFSIACVRDGAGRIHSLMGILCEAEPAKGERSSKAIGAEQPTTR